MNVKYVENTMPKKKILGCIQRHTMLQILMNALYVEKSLLGRFSYPNINNVIIQIRKKIIVNVSRAVTI